MHLPQQRGVFGKRTESDALAPRVDVGLVLDRLRHPHAVDFAELRAVDLRLSFADAHAIDGRGQEAAADVAALRRLGHEIEMLLQRFGLRMLEDGPNRA